MLDETSFRVLNAVYLKKLTTVPSIAELIDVPMEAVETVAARCSGDGTMLSLPAGVMLTPTGIDEVRDYSRAAYKSVRQGNELETWYPRFEVLNTRFIELVTEWQRSGGEERVSEKVIQVCDRLVKAIEELVPSIPRYTEYVTRFVRSMDRVDRGDREYVSNPTKDSLHNIWFEFHEDVLGVLDRPRDTT